MAKALFAILVMIAVSGMAGDWDRFRGPNGGGVSNATGLPVEFGPNKNIDWRRDVPFGRSSPIVAGERLVLTGREGNRLMTLCLDRKTGRTIWEREVSGVLTRKIYKGNDTATPTPASDGENFYVFFPDFGLISYGPNGKERWQVKLGPFNSFYGMSASPVVYRNTVIQVCDQKGGSFIIALNKDTGGVQWRKDRPHATIEAFSTPIVWEPKSAAAQLVVSGSYRIDGYAIDSGECLWWVGKQGTSPISTPVMEGEIIFAASTGGEQAMLPPWNKVSDLDKNKDGKISSEEARADSMMGDHFGWIDRNGDELVTEGEWEEILKLSVSEHGLVAVRAGGKGDQTESHLIWRDKKNYSEVTSPLAYKGVLYVVKDGGIVTSLNPSTGEVFKTGRSEKAIEAYFASPVAADGKVYLVSNEGKVSVLKAGPQWEVLTVNDLGEECQATPAISSGRIFIRTAKALYSFGERR